MFLNENEKLFGQGFMIFLSLGTRSYVGVPPFLAMSILSEKENSVGKKFYLGRIFVVNLGSNEKA